MFTLVRFILYTLVVYNLSYSGLNQWVTVGICSTFFVNELVLYVLGRTAKRQESMIKLLMRIGEGHKLKPFQFSLPVSFSSHPIESVEQAVVDGVKEGDVNSSTRLLQLRCNQSVDFNDFPVDLRIELANRLVSDIEDSSYPNDWDEYLN